jgi:hypothetical protein
MKRSKITGLKGAVRSILTLILVMVMVLNVDIMKPKAADVSVSISLSASTVSVGSGVSATISVSGGSISAYTMYVSYNSGVLQYNSGSGATINGGGGTIVVSGTSSGTISLSFTAIANGSSSISTSGSDFLNIDGNALSVSHAGVTVTVATNQTTESTANNNTTNNSTTNNTNSDDTTAGNSTETSEASTTEEDNRSDNCNLSSLQITPGTLEPAFSSGTTSYNVQVDEDVTSMVVSATPEDSKATTQVWGAGLIEPGENTVKITVTAENGAVKVYNIRVMAGEDKGEANVTIDDEFYKFADNQNVDDIPDGFTDTSITYKDWDVLAFKSPNKKVTIVCLIDVEGNLKWFVYDEENDAFTPYQEFSSNYNRYIIMDIPEDSEYLDGFELTETDIDGFTVQALKSDVLNDSSLYVIYAMNIEGDEAYYLYDAAEGTFMRYVAPSVEEEESAEATMTDVATVTDVTDDEPEQTKQIDATIYVLLAIAGVLALLFLILFIIMLVRCSTLKNQAQTAEDMVDSLGGSRDGSAANADKSTKATSTFNLENLQNAEAEKTVSQGKIELPHGRKMDRNTSFVDAVNSEEPIKFGEAAEKLAADEDTKDNSISEIPSVDLGFGDSLEIGYKPDEKERNFREYEDESEKINSRIMEGYDVESDSAFEDTRVIQASDVSGEVDSDKIDDTDK